MSVDKQTRRKSKKNSDFQRLSRRFMSGLLRSLFFLNRPVRSRQAGFVLPTTVLLLLVVTLTAGAMGYRSFSRTSNVIALREQQVIDNAAAPAIDRAKAKLEYLFSKDDRFPGGVPASDVIASMMLNDGNNGIPSVPNNPYELPDETPIDLNGGGNDNAWVFNADVDGDGNADELIAYSILMDDLDPGATDATTDDILLTDDLSGDKADALVTRNGPISTTQAQAGCTSARAPEGGWQVINEATLQKNFQVTAFVVNGSDVNRTATALEFQQVRQANRGNKWGAWFKYDLELFPGATRNFFWNGAMHTEGNLLVRDKYRARMLSSHNSCLYTQDSSEITLAENENFRGEVLSAKSGSNSFTDSGIVPLFHLFTSDNARPQTGDNGELTTSSDSVTAGDGHLRDILLDPIKLFTEDVLAHRGESSDDGWSHDDEWDKGAFVSAKRIYNEESPIPYLDDTFRADNRYGPKPVYDKFNAIPDKVAVGTPITGNTALTALNSADGLYGLDGYWERRAIGQGLRVIVGQRLELGDAFGWKGNDEPLYPVRDSSVVPTQARQRKSLYDNLAAVQGMVVYHHESGNSGRLPLACIASTAHPGTQQTIVKSRTFENYPGSSTQKIDFLTGEGTNGWEFDFYSSFSSKFNDVDSPLRTALTNLAYFAGDPFGGAPSFVPQQDTDVVHPYPYQSMWGDFSNLRRIIASGDKYKDLSPADQSTLHSSACTLGLLAHSLKTQQNVSTASYFPNQGAAVTLGAKLIDVIGASKKGPDGSKPASACTPSSNPNYDFDCKDVVLDKDSLIDTSGLNPSDKAAARFVGAMTQIERDRKYGFVPSASSSSEYKDYIAQNGNGSGNKKYRFRIHESCHPETSGGIVNEMFKSSDSSKNRDNKAAIALFCNPTTPKYPSLYYLFPAEEHDQKGTGTAYVQPDSEEYIKPPSPNPDYISRSTVNGNVLYKTVGDGSISDTGIGSIALTPQPIDNWKLPTSDASGSFDSETMQIDASGTLKEVSLLDKGMYDGRELLSLRMLDFDINKLSGKQNVSDHWIADVDGIVYAFREDAVREDSIVRPAVSGVSWGDCDEWSKVYKNVSSNNAVHSNKNGCRMTISSGVLEDPPLMTDTKISTKPIDFYPDPNRRPYGFRLVNGKTLNRINSTTPDDSILSGMTFVSDNTVYIKGDFNLHSSTGDLGSTNACSSLIEEFTERLFADNCSDRTQNAAGTDASASFDFYDDRGKDERNEDNFADPTVDHWRPVEIVGDAVGVLSSAFKDGSIEDGFALDRTQGQDGYGLSSYQNQNRLKANDHASITWKRVVSAGTPNSTDYPIFVSRDGAWQKDNGDIIGADQFIRVTGTNKTTFNEYNDKRGGDLQPAVRTVANAVFISGIVPSQAGQTYGGMHNFPRFLEHWKSVDLLISGGFFQLNFSTSATAPFDQDAWEPGTNPILGDKAYRTRFYGAPNRYWGYDVGLQYAPAGPVARRFVTVGRPRSEFYRELPVEDPYVHNLRCAVVGTRRVDPALDASDCT